MMGLFKSKKGKKEAKPSSSRRGKRRGKPERVPLATDQLSRKDQKRLKKTLKTYNKKVPILNELHPKAIAASYMSEHLAKYADEKDGAVRLLVDNSGNQAYSVLIVSESDLEDAGFTANKKQDPDAYMDLGQLGAQISRNQIVTATTILDYEHKHLVIVPTADTIDALGEYDEFNSCEFTWAAYPLEGMDDVTKAQVMPLANKISLAELKQISVDGSDLALNNDNEVAIVSDDDSSDDAGMDTTNPNDGGFDPTDELNNPVNDDVNTGVSVNPQNPPANGNVVPPVQMGAPASNLNQAPASPTSQPMPNMSTQAMLDGSDNTVPPIAPTMPQAPVTPAQQDSVNSNTLGDLMKASGMTTDPASAANMSLDDLPDDNGSVAATTANGADDIIPAAQSQDEFSANLAEANGAVQTFRETVDDDLNLVIDYSVFDDQSQHHKPIQFSIPQVSDNDRLGQLANQYRRNFNSQLQAANQAQESALRGVFESRTREAASYISQRLNALKGNNSKLAEKDAEIEERYKENRANFEQVWQGKVVERQQDFEKRKQQAGEAAKQKAIAEFDANNRAQFESSLRADKSREEASLSSQYINEKSELQRQKIKIGQAAFSATMVRIMKDINNVRQANYEENKAMFEKFEATIQDLLNKHYEGEQNRQIAAAKALDHDDSVKQAEAKVIQIEKEYKEKLRKAQRDADERVAKISRLTDDNVKQAKESYQAQIDTLETRLKQAQEDSAKAEKKYHADIAQVRQEGQDEIDRIVAEHDRSSKMSDSQYDRARKNSLLITILAIVAALLVGVLLGGFFKKSSTPQPVQQQTTTQAPRSDSQTNQGGTKIYVNGGNADSTKESSSHKVAAGEDNTTSESHQTKAANSNND